MDAPILFLHVGYMSAYDGPGDIRHGGAFVDEHHEGGEMWNFAPYMGRCYGYVMSHGFAGVDLNRVAPHPRRRKWEKGLALPGVTVVFTATRDNVGRIIVGWYENAVVYHRTYLPRPDGVRFSATDEVGSYVCEVDSEHAFLVPENHRTFVMPRGEGFPSQTQIWYANPPRNERVKDYLAMVRELTGVRPRASLEVIPAAHRPTYTSDPELTLNIERAAVRAVTAWLSQQGYQVHSVERDKVGWDLDAVCGDERLRIEVKGHLGADVHFELTPNEFSALQRFADSYRIGLVRNALSETPRVALFHPVLNPPSHSWFLLAESGEEIGLEPRIGARAHTLL